jgi:hypothetical protein
VPTPPCAFGVVRAVRTPWANRCRRLKKPRARASSVAGSRRTMAMRRPATTSAANGVTPPKGALFNCAQNGSAI